MTYATPTRSALSAPSSSKCLPKRAVSFAKACKYHFPCQVNMTDEILQSTDNRRRYQRRGSKTPAMLQLSKTDLAHIQDFQPSLPDKQIDCASTTTAAHRRMSLMTALRQNLEGSCILEPVMAKTIRRMSMDQTGVIHLSCTRSWA